MIPLEDTCRLLLSNSGSPKMKKTAPTKENWIFLIFGEKLKIWGKGNCMEKGKWLYIMPIYGRRDPGAEIKHFRKWEAWEGLPNYFNTVQLWFPISLDDVTVLKTDKKGSLVPAFVTVKGTRSWKIRVMLFSHHACIMQDTILKAECLYFWRIQREKVVM